MANDRIVISPDGFNFKRQYSTFYVGDTFFGVEVSKVQEVLRYQNMTPVPLAPPEIEGLINLRGQIVTAVDMRRVLQMEPREAGTLPMNVIVRAEGGAVSLLVDEIGDVIEPPRASYEPPPETMPLAQREMIEGIYKLDGKLLLILGTDRVLSMESSGNAMAGVTT